MTHGMDVDRETRPVDEPPVARPQTCGMATASLVLGLCSLLFWILVPRIEFSMNYIKSYLVEVRLSNVETNFVERIFSIQ